MASTRLVAALDALERTPYRGTAFRHQAAQWHPLSGAGARSLGGRWNPPQSFATLYLGLDPQTVAAEFLRMAARHGRALEDFLPRHVYRYRVELQALADLSESTVREAVGLRDDDLYGDEPSACQVIGEAAQHLGREGILAPSATGQGRILAIFVDRLEAGSVVEAEDFEVWKAPPRP